MERKATIAVSNETESSATRLTREGKQIKYSLKVIQQPQRARACGAGAKSSADRRPVDPPPIVELKIYEVKPDNAVEDITFTMNANYFLFATLENSRHIAQARGMPEKGPTVLTGTPVAGMVYLDRPTPAGYFIFPDLSVRHEGHYRLSFSLYEELKRIEDADKNEDPANGSAPSDSHVTHRLEVKSEPLQVYSAKKFPGLTESTALSRTVAEQGCRVRIRRDVRLRRRDTKATDGAWDDYEEETSKARARMTATPDRSYSGYAPLQAPPGPMEPNPRPRSASSASHHSLAASISRRPSLHDMTHAYHQQQQYGGTAPHTPQNGFAAAPFGPSPTQQYSQPPYMQQQGMQPPPPQYPTQTYQPAPVMPSPASQQPSYYSYQPAPAAQQPQYAQPTYEASGHAHRASGDWNSQPSADYRRSSVQQAQLAPSQPQSMYVAQPSYPTQQYQQPPPPAYQSQPTQQSQYHTPAETLSTRAPPLEPVQPPTRLDVPTPPITAKTSFASNTLPPLSGTAFSRQPEPKLEASTPTSAIQTNGHSYSANSALPQTPIDSHKRSHASTFPTQSYQSQKSGARPAEYQTPSDFLFAGADGEDDDYQDYCNDGKGGICKTYKRADGSYASRPGVRAI